jgi:hypothetical protein
MVAGWFLDKCLGTIQEKAGEIAGIFSKSATLSYLAVSVKPTNP